MSEPAQPTPAETEIDATTVSEKVNFWTAVFMSMEGDPKLDWDKLVKLMGYKNVASARAMYGMNKRKLLGGVAQPSSSGQSPGSARKSPSEKKGGKAGKVKPAATGDGVSRPRGRPKKQKVLPKEQEEGENSDEKVEGG